MDLLITLTALLGCIAVCCAVLIRRKRKEKRILEAFYAPKPVQEQKLVLTSISTERLTSSTGSVAYSQSNNDALAKTVSHRKAALKQDVYSTITFQYCDADGFLTERTVDVTMGKRGESFRGYCHLRREERTFFFDRICSPTVKDVQTGLDMSPREWRYYLQGTKKAFEDWQDELSTKK